MKNYSIWNQNIKENVYQKIEEDKNVDVLIVGGGMTGLSTLYHLKNSNLKCILVERNVCGSGVSSRSTAKITLLQENIISNIRKYVGDKEAQTYLNSQIDAIKKIREMIEVEKIDCDLKKVSSYLFANEEKNLELLESEYQFLRENGIDASLEKTLPFDVPCKLALKVDDTYEFHVLKFLNWIKNKFKENIYEYSKVQNINKKEDYYLCKVNGSNIKAKNVVIANHYPYFIFPFLFPFKNHVETSFIGAKEVKDFKPINGINLDKPTISFRYHTEGKKHYLIYLLDSLPSCNVKNIDEYFKHLETKYQFDYLWSNKDIITNDYIPFIGRINSKQPNLLIGCGYNTWGMTNGFLAGSILSDIILNKENPYIKLFDPSRKFNIGKLLRFPIDTGRSIKAILKSTKSNTNNEKVIYTKIKGKSVAIVHDKNGKEHIVLNRCPHMKCGLVFNELEQTWECLCHGSRFQIDGKCINGPSNLDITFK